MNSNFDLKGSNQMQENIGQITSRYVLPVIEEKTSYGYKRMDPYTKLFEERIIFLGQAIDDTVANDVMAQLLTLESMDPDRDIMIYINSPGGSFTALTAIYDTMQFIKPAVATLCMGQAASMGSLLLAAGHKDMRFALPNSRVMLHQPSGGFQGQASDIERHAADILKLKRRLNEVYVKHTGNDYDTIEKTLDRDHFMTADEAVDFGVIDKVIASRDEIENGEGS